MTFFLGTSHGAESGHNFAVLRRRIIGHGMFIEYCAITKFDPCINAGVSPTKKKITAN